MTQMTQVEDSKKQNTCTNTACCPPAQPFRNLKAKIGRNDLCPCGSQKKYKKCCYSN